MQVINEGTQVTQSVHNPEWREYQLKKDGLKAMCIGHEDGHFIGQNVN
jgi:peptide deformylase